MRWRRTCHGACSRFVEADPRGGHEQARAIYEETKLFFSRTGYRVVDLYATLGEYDFVSIVEVPDQNAIQHLFRRGILAAAHGSFQVCTLPALPFEEFVKVVDEIRPSEPPTIGVNE